MRLPRGRAPQWGGVTFRQPEPSGKAVSVGSYLMRSCGIHPNIVQEILGHSTITLALGTISHFTPRRCTLRR